MYIQASKSRESKNIGVVRHTLGDLPSSILRAEILLEIGWSCAHRTELEFFGSCCLDGGRLGRLCTYNQSRYVQSDFPNVNVEYLGTVEYLLKCLYPQTEFLTHASRPGSYM